jgi:RNA polymerase sigma-70 factor (ECF subfamily)
MEAARGGPEDTVALVGRIAAGDRDAFARSYDATAAAASGLTRRIVGDPVAAEDVLLRGRVDLG